MAGGIPRCEEHEALLRWATVWKPRVRAAKAGGLLPPKVADGLCKVINNECKPMLKTLDDLFDRSELDEYLKKAKAYWKHITENVEPCLDADLRPVVLKVNQTRRF